MMRIHLNYDYYQHTKRDNICLMIYRGFCEYYSGTELHCRLQIGLSICLHAARYIPIHSLTARLDATQCIWQSGICANTRTLPWLYNYMYLNLTCPGPP